MSLLCLCTTLSSGDHYNRKKGGTRRLLVFSRWIRLESDPHTVLLKSVCHLLNFLVFYKFIKQIFIFDNDKLIKYKMHFEMMILFSLGHQYSKPTDVKCCLAF